jgi:hypothetical protein
VINYNSEIHDDGKERKLGLGLNGVARCLII